MVKILKTLAAVAGAMILWIATSPKRHKVHICNTCGLETQIYYVPRKTKAFMNCEVGRYMCMKCIALFVKDPTIIEVMQI